MKLSQNIENLIRQLSINTTAIEEEIEVLEEKEDANSEDEKYELQQIVSDIISLQEKLEKHFNIGIYA